MHLAQLVPGFAPQMDGIGDYAMVLAKQLRDRQGIDSTFIVFNPSWTGPNEIGGFRVLHLPSSHPAALVDLLASIFNKGDGHPDSLLVQFAPYGYEKRGCPRWLASALEMWNTRHPGTTRILFHEMEVDSRQFWRSEFWLQRLQRKIVERIHRVSALSFVNSHMNLRKLERAGSGRAIFIPNFSTMGEPASKPPFELRKRQVVIFGRSWQRRKAYEEGGESLKNVCQWIHAEEIIDIGDPLPEEQYKEVGGVRIRHCGRLDECDVSHYMQSSIATFMSYPVSLLTKSSVFAASCAHGAIPFIDDKSAAELGDTDLLPGQDYFLVAENDHAGPIDLKTATDIVYERYQSRASWNAAACIASELKRDTVSVESFA